MEKENEVEKQEPVTQTEEKTEVTVTEPVEKTEKAEVKTFTQEEVNAMLAKEKKKMPSKEELKEFKEWQESKKTEAEKQAEKEAEYQKTLNELNTLKQTNAVLEAGVNKEDADYVLFKVSKMEGEFDENLAKFLKDNPKYFEKELTQTEPKATGTSVKSISSDENGVTAILKAKHPELFERKDD